MHSYGIGILIASSVGFLVVFAFAFFCFLACVRREKRERERAQENTRYILDVERNLFAASIQPERFEDALRRIADYLSAENVFFWGSGAFEGKQLWSTDGMEYEKDITFQNKFPGLCQRIEKENEIICNDMNLCTDVCSEEKELLLAHNVKSLMSISVRQSNGRMIGVLGAVNMKSHWETATPLLQVSLSFAMTAEQYLSSRRLDWMGQTDLMTGLMNRNSYHIALDAAANIELNSMACVYIDVNGLHEVNNRLGHQAGDEMLMRTADALKSCFPLDSIYRIGGDEFLVLCHNRTEEEVSQSAKRTCRLVGEFGYTLSIGVSAQEKNVNIGKLVDDAEARMRSDKRRFYKANGKEEQQRMLDEKAVEMTLKRQDTDLFLSVIAPLFKGVYFVDIKRDSLRHIFIPPYFEEILKEEDGSFVKGIRLYFERLVKPEYGSLFEEFYHFVCTLRNPKEKLVPEFRYQKKDGSWIRLCVMEAEGSVRVYGETLWIFWDDNQVLEIGGG